MTHLSQRAFHAIYPPDSPLFVLFASLLRRKIGRDVKNTLRDLANQFLFTKREKERETEKRYTSIAYEAECSAARFPAGIQIKERQETKHGEVTAC